MDDSLNVSSVVWKDDEFQYTDELVGGTLSYLHQTKCVHRFSQTNGVRVNHIFHMDVEVAANYKYTAK